MKQKGFFSTFPLPEAMTHRVVSYLSVFRLLISMILLYAFFTDLVAVPHTLDKSAIGGTALLSYFAMSVYLALDNRRRATEPYPFALVTLFTDLLFISVLLFIFRAAGKWYCGPAHIRQRICRRAAAAADCAALCLPGRNCIHWSGRDGLAGSG